MKMVQMQYKLGRSKELEIKGLETKVKFSV